MISKFKNLYIATSEGAFASIDKKTFNVTGEIVHQYSSSQGGKTMYEYSAIVGLACS